MIRAAGLHKEYHMGDSVVHALDGVDLNINAGEFVSIVGASGSGKSTLMHILGCLDRPSSGTYEFDGAMVSSLSDRKLATIRNQHIGFVFQTFNLIGRTSALENVIVPLMYTRQAYARKTAVEALERVGIAKRAKHTPSELSGGECQRVAIARAIVNNPKLMFADEPTGNLDSKTGNQIMSVFHDLHANGMTIILVTHEMEVAIQATRMLRMRDGRIIEDTAIDDEHRTEVIAEARDAQRNMFRQKSTARGSPNTSIPDTTSFEIAD